MSEQKMGRRARRPTREDVYQRLDSHIAELWQRLGGLPNPLEALDIWRGIWYEEAHHSTALEGNTLVLKEVEALRERHVHRRERMHGSLPGRAPSDRWQRGAGSGPEPASPKRQRISISSKFGSCRRR